MLVTSVIKLDVEGFELKVIRGLKRSLESPAAHTVGIEMQLGILRARGLPGAPREIEAILCEHRCTLSGSMRVTCLQGADAQCA